MSSTACYQKDPDQGIYIHPAYFPCGQPISGNQAASCCNLGHTCLSSGFCYYPSEVPNGSHYYLAGCTDPSMKDPGCSTACQSTNQTDAVWDVNSDGWSCCGYSGTLHCDNPMGPMFNAPPPSQLYSLGSLLSDGRFIPEPSSAVASWSLSASLVAASGSAQGSNVLAPSSVQPSPFQSSIPPATGVGDTSSVVPSMGPVPTATVAALTKASTETAEVYTETAKIYTKTAEVYTKTAEIYAETAKVYTAITTATAVTTALSSKTLTAPPSGLSLTGLAIIATVIPLFGIVALVAILFHVRRRRHRAKVMDVVSPLPGAEKPTNDVKGKMGLEISQPIQSQELEHTERNLPEMSSDMSFIELDAEGNNWI